MNHPLDDECGSTPQAALWPLHNHIRDLAHPNEQRGNGLENRHRSDVRRQQREGLHRRLEEVGAARDDEDVRVARDVLHALLEAQQAAVTALHTTLHQRITALALLELVVDVATRELESVGSHHDGTKQLDHGNDERAVRRGAEMVAHSTEERLRQRVDADALLRLRHLARAHVLLLEVPLAHRARDRHDADGVDESGGPEEHEEVPEAENHVGRRVLFDGARDEGAVGHRVGVLADHRRGVLRYASSERNE